ncbi:MAG: tetratricopeptide repeat protein [Calditrichota bacterium]
MRRVLVIITILGLMGACSQKPTVEQLMSSAQELSKQGDFTAAGKTYEEVLRRDDVPDSLRARSLFALAENAGNQKNYQDAIGYYRQLVYKYGATKWAPKAQFMIGYVYANLIHDYSRAKQEYQKFLDIYPGHELVSAVQFELKYLGKDMTNADFLKFLNSSGKQSDE